MSVVHPLRFGMVEVDDAEGPHAGDQGLRSGDVGQHPTDRRLEPLDLLKGVRADHRAQQLAGRPDSVRVEAGGLSVLANLLSNLKNGAASLDFDGADLVQIDITSAAEGADPPTVDQLQNELQGFFQQRMTSIDHQAASPLATA